MAKITFLGGEETGNVDHVEWGAYRFDLRVPTDCKDAHIVKKAMGNRFFSVEEENGHSGEIMPPDRMAKARAAKAAKRDAA